MEVAPLGYWLVDAVGGVFCFGDALFHGSQPERGIAARAVGIAAAENGAGYWIAGADGSLCAFGGAAHLTRHRADPGAPVVAIAATPSGRGVWLLDRSGGVHARGDAPMHGSLPGLRVATVAVAMAPTPDGDGYWILDAAGGVFTFGAASFAGSLAGKGVSAAPVGIAAGPEGGYLVADRGGGVHALGAPFEGSVPELDVAATPRGVVAILGRGGRGGGGGNGGNGGNGGSGYYLIGVDGLVLPFGPVPFLGSLAAAPPGAPIVGACLATHPR